MTEFFDRWNRRQSDELVALFADYLEFNDSVAGQKRTARDRRQLRAYVEERFALADGFSGLVVDMPERPDPASANPTARFSRSVSGTVYAGNAKLVCGAGLLVVVNMSAE